MYLKRDEVALFNGYQKALTCDGDEHSIQTCLELNKIIHSLLIRSGEQYVSLAVSVILALSIVVNVSSLVLRGAVVVGSVTEKLVKEAQLEGMGNPY